MKKFAALFAVVVSLVVATTLLAGDYYAYYGTGTTAASAVAPSIRGKKPVLTAYNATSDKAASVLKVYTADSSYSLTDGTAASGQKIVPVASTSGFDQYDYVVIQKQTGVVEWNQITSITSGVSLNMVTNLTNTLAVGDKVYEMKQVASFPVGASTTSMTSNALGILGGAASSPVIALLDGTSACSINVFSITYE